MIGFILYIIFILLGVLVDKFSIIQHNQANNPLCFFSVFSIISCGPFLLGFRLYFNSIYSTCFSLFPISTSKAFKACSSMTTFCLRELTVSSSLYSTRIPPTTFHVLRSPYRGRMLLRTRLFSLLSSSS